MEPKLSKSLQDANSYVEKNKIEKTISEAVNRAVQGRESRPIISMIKYLISVTPPDILESQGIIVNHLDL